MHRPSSSRLTDVHADPLLGLGGRDGLGSGVHGDAASRFLGGDNHVQQSPRDQGSLGERRGGEEPRGALP